MERVVHATRAVIYTFDKNGQSWQCTSEPATLTDVYVLYSRDGRYRIIGRAVNGEGWDLNSPIYATLTLQKVSSFFVQWQDPGRVHGLAFADDQHMQKFCRVVTLCENNVRTHPPRQPGAAALRSPLGHSGSSLPSASSSSSFGPAAPRSDSSSAAPMARRATSTALPVPQLNMSSSDAGGTLGRSAASKLSGSDDKKPKKGGRSLFRPVSVMMSGSNLREQMALHNKQSSSGSMRQPPQAPASAPVDGGDNNNDLPASGSSTSRASPSPSSAAENLMDTILNAGKVPMVPQSRRDHAALEIYTTECAYVKSLYAIVDELMPSFAALALDGDHTAAIFCNVKQIRILNSQFLMQIHPLIQSWDNESTTIGDAFKILTDYAKAYVQYYQNYESVPPTIEALKKQRPFAKWLASSDVEVLTGGQGLLQLLIKPCQRFMRYSLLIGELLKQTPDSHPDHAALKQAYERIADAISTINAKVEDMHMQQKRDEIRKGKDFVGFDQLLSADLSLSSSSSTSLSPSSSSASDRQIRHFTPCSIPVGAGTEYTWMSLWDDCIAFASDSVDKRGQTKKKFEQHIVLEHAWLAPGPSDTVLEIITPGDFFMATMISRAERDKWIDVFEQAVHRRIADITSVTRLSDTRRQFAYTFAEGVYTGEWELGKIDGPGTFEYKSGAVYTGNFVRGKRHGRGKMSYDGGRSSYDGDWENDQPHGSGVLDLAAVGVYTGGWEKGRKHGAGVMQWINGDRYDGAWQADYMCGAGVLTLANGFVYDGDFVGNAFHGQGKLSSFGSVYTGQWHADRKEGTGVMHYASGAVYEGEWKNDCRHGKGVYTTKDGKLRYEGDWDDDMMHGQGNLAVQQQYTYVGAFAKDYKSGHGTWTHVDGATYTGSWLDDKREGEGEYTDPFGGSYAGHWHADKRIGKGTEKYPDGSVYQGDFFRDKKHGNGKMTYPDGSIYAGEWADDRRHGKGTFRLANASSYSGDWDAGLRHGAGKWRDAAGEFEGQWKNDFREGAGNHKHDRDKSLLAGSWKNDVPDGRATLTRPDGSQIELAFSEGRIDRPLLSDIAPYLPFTRMTFR